jgi:cytochrome bd-type quinol oxidase subunit 1
MSRNWRISSFTGVLLAAYFIPAWTIVAYRIMVSPVQGLFERPSVSVAFFITDHLQLASMTIVRIAWLLALSRLTVVLFLAIFVVLALLALIRRTDDHKEPLAIALTIGSVISFASMILASKVGEIEALRMHATELLMMLGAVVVLVFEAPAQPRADDAVEANADLALERAQLTNNG